MKKIVISKLFLYRYRFYIGYTLLGIAFVTILFILPLISPRGLSTAEMKSAISSAELNFHSITSGELADLPYHTLQKLSLMLFGLSFYSIKLPSIIIGLCLGLTLIALLNRWFKSNVALFASILTVLSTPFLYLAGNGTPLIMLVFWPTFLLWLGSKIQGVNKPRPAFCFIFAFALLLSIFTPHLIYLAAFIVIFAFAQPHLRYTIKTLPKIPLIVSSLFGLAGITILSINIAARPHVAASLLFMPSFSLSQFLANLNSGFAPFFSWNSNLENVLLSPLINLAVLALAFTGLISTTKGFFASRNSIASYFILFTLFLTGLHPDSAILIILPLSILIAHGLRYILEKWYGLFPENPYARIFAILPISIFLGITLVADLSHFIFGYRYNPAVANQFNNDLSLIQAQENHPPILVAEDSLEHHFYRLLGESRIALDLSDPTLSQVIALEKIENPPSKFSLSRIITSPKADNSDRIYLYTVKQEWIMGRTMDQVKMLNQLRKAQKALKNEIVEVEAGDGAVKVQINGELKIKKISIDPDRVDLDDIRELERWLENCLRDGYAKAQEIASDKMKPFMSGLGDLGF